MDSAWNWIEAGKQKEGKDLINHLAFHFSVQLLNFEPNSDHESRVSPLLMLARGGGSKAEALLSSETDQSRSLGATFGPMNDLDKINT